MREEENSIAYDPSRNEIIVCSTFQDKNIIKACGGVWQGGPYWRLPLLIRNIEYLLDNLPDVIVGDGIVEAVEAQVEREETLASLRIKAKNDESIDIEIPGLSDGTSLHRYQKIGVEYAITSPSGLLLADSMGLGKSIQALATALVKKERDGVSHCLIVVPASLKWNWPLEISKFTNEKFVVIDGKPDERIAQWLGQVECRYVDGNRIVYSKNEPETGDVFFYVVNFELVLEDLFGGKDVKIKESDSEKVKARKAKTKKTAQDRAKALKTVKERTFPMIVIDECHALKNHKSKRTKNIKALKSSYRMGLTGTPVDGKLEEMHSIMEWIQPGLFESKTSFLAKYAKFDFWGTVIGYHNIKEVTERIQPFFLRRMKEDVLKDLPPKVYQNRIIELSAEEKRIYRQIASRKHEITEDEEAMVAAIRCKQFCDCPSLIDINTKKSSKLDAFKEIMDELVIQNGFKVLVFSQYAKMCEILIKEMDKMKLNHFYIWNKTPKKKRADMQEVFNTDVDLDVLIGTEAMSMGLNLTGATYVINYDDNWSPAIMDQRSDRAHRLGQLSSVTVINFICQDTIEERIRDVIFSKAQISANILGDDTDEAVLKRLGPEEILALL